jgi:LysR family hydrogen peroxide-inducible transcriptional activator
MVGRHMELQHIRYFLALCEEHNFGRAARRCGVAQPSLTKAIKRLEESVGGILFQRRPHAQPTMLALAIKPDLEQMMLSAQLALQKAKHIRTAHFTPGGFQ